MESLFDNIEEPDWQEVPQARFLSWSDAQQYAYCAARDEDSAARALTPEDALWFSERALIYWKLVQELKNR